MKNFYFLSGLFRTGNTVLSAILNQNPNIYSSPLSPVAHYMWDATRMETYSENVILSKSLSKDYPSKILNSFYSNIDKPVVIDRNKIWGVPDYFNMLSNVVEKPKIIFTYRPILEILASFISLLPDESFIDKEMRDSGWWYKDYLSKNDNRCDYLMRPYGEIDRILLSFNTIKEYPNNFCLIEYNNLVLNPQESLNKIYDFIGMDNYEHDLSNIIKHESEIELDFNLKKPLHEVRKSISRTSLPVEDVLSEYIITKYGCLDFKLLE